MKTLNQYKKEFEEKFGSKSHFVGLPSIEGERKMWEFIESTIHSLMKEVVPEEKTMEAADLQKTVYINGGDMSDAIENHAGFNLAITETKENISKLMK